MTARKKKDFNNFIIEMIAGLESLGMGWWMRVATPCHQSKRGLKFAGENFFFHALYRIRQGRLVRH